jgi:hypothetical protein
MKESTIRRIVNVVDELSTISFYAGRIVGNFKRGYRGCYTPMFEDQQKQHIMDIYEEERRRHQRKIQKEIHNEEKNLRVVGFK